MTKKLLLIGFTLVLNYLCMSSQNLLTNSGFETWGGGGGGGTPTGWTIVTPQSGTITQNSTLFNEGTKSCRIVTNNTGNYSLLQSVAVTAGKTYSFKICYYIETASGNLKDARIACNFRTATAAIPMTLEDSLSLKGPGGVNGYFPSVSGVWKTYTYDVVAPVGATAFVVSFAVSRNATVSWDNLSFSEMTVPTIYKYTYNSTSGFNYSPSMSGFDYVPSAGPSGEQAFAVKASNLTGSLIVTAPSNYEISAYSGASFVGQSAITIANSGGMVSAIPIYIRLKSGLPAATYSANISLTSAGAISQTIPVVGIVGVPPVTITPSVNQLNGFTYVDGSGPSAQLSFTVAGSNLTAGIVVTAPVNYEISVLSGTSFNGTNSFILAQTAGAIAPTILYVRLKAGLTAGTYSGNITLASAGGTTQSLLLSGTVTNLPGVTVSAASLLGFSYTYNSGPSSIQSFTVNGVSLSSVMIVTAPSGYEISTEAGIAFTGTNQIILPQSGALTTIYVRLKGGLTAASYLGSISVASTGFITKNLVLSGTVLPLTALDQLTEDVVKITTVGSSILVTGTLPNELVSIFSVTGQRLQSVKSNGEQVVFTAKYGAVYMVRTSSKAYKVIL